jgi:hypothetical protein
VAATLKYWNGSAWVAKPLKYWNGSAWVAKTLRYWDGTQWLPASGTVYFDNFNRANASLELSSVASGGWTWSHDGLIADAGQIVSNILRGNTTNATGSAYKTPALPSNLHYVQYKVGVLATSGPFCAGRLADRNNFVGIRNDGSTVECFRRVAGSLTSLPTSGATCAIGDMIRIEFPTTTTYVLKKNGAVVQASTAIGATLTDVGTGVVMRTTTGSFFDEFEAGTL